ncbi:MAG: hemerythrin domain-containing protein [Deltaproteobacteria bacterium]|nr:hemerythrin domain-containing protein [Deltaproteobacteria bacterium]
MDILTLLRRDHDAFFAAIPVLEALLEPGAFQRATVRSLGHALVLQLQVHARGEERSLYAGLFDLARAPPAVREHLDRKGREGVCEHKCIDDAALRFEALLDDDRSLRADILAELTVLGELLDHHARVEEEGLLFPEVERRFSLEERLAMGAEMEALRLALSVAPERMRHRAILAAGGVR